MLETFPLSPYQISRLRQGLLADFTDALAQDLHRDGYTDETAISYLTIIGKFSRYAEGLGIREIGTVDESLVDRFLTELRRESRSAAAPWALAFLLKSLRRRALIPNAIPLPPEEPFDGLLREYDVYLRDLRGMEDHSRKYYLSIARRLLLWHRKRHADRPLSELSGADVLGFITDRAAMRPDRRPGHSVCTIVRSFLRYLRWQEILTVDLDRVVPRVPEWRLSSVPRHLCWEDVRKLIDSIDTSHPCGMRDKAMILLMATLGLRSKEVRTLEIKHIRWRAAEIHLPRTKNRQERVLPLPEEPGAAMARYLQGGRPCSELPYVFLRHRAPVGPLRSSTAISDMVRKHLDRAGIETPVPGAHLLRHSLATRMVNRGIVPKQIADLLGHASVDSTASYAKVDRSRLIIAALPFPGGEA